MATTWKYSIGNLVRRAPADPAAVAPAAEDALLPLANIANDYPDEQAGFEWRSDGVYDVDLDLNLLPPWLVDQDRADDMYGWMDYLLMLAGTPGLPAADVRLDVDSAGSRNCYRLHRPVFYDVDVMPGENFQLNIGLYLESGESQDQTGARVSVIDLWSGKGWNGSAWAAGGVVATQSTPDVWLDTQEEIVADANRTVRSTYRVIAEPTGAAYSSVGRIHMSMYNTDGAPALIAEADTAAIIGHNIPTGSTVSCGPISMGTPAFPSWKVESTSSYTQTWRLSIDTPTGPPVHPRPIIGELWIGKARTLQRNPVKVSIKEGDPNQQRVVSARNRIEVLSDRARVPASILTFNFKLPETEYVQARDELNGATLFGAEPILWMPDATFEGTGRLYHARMGEEVQYGRIGDFIRTFAVEMIESPLAAP